METEIYLIDDDESVRRAMSRLIRSVGMELQTFTSAEDFLDYKGINQDACMIVDIKLQGMSGLALYEELRAKGYDLPVIFITGFDTPETRHQAKNAGTGSEDGI